MKAGALALLALAAAVLLGPPLADRVKEAFESKLSQSDGTRYRVAALFDTAKGVQPGQLVKIAGARAGTIDAVRLTRDYKARIEMQVDSRLAPFRSDARCSIQPEGLIGERFVQCDPGTPRGRPLEARAGATPVVPLERTTTPVSLTDLFQILNAPARERGRLAIATLGMGLAGRGEDLNAVLRRANPALGRVHGVLTRLRRQRTRLARSVRSTDRVVAELARRRDRVRSFIGHAARVTKQTGSRRRETEEAIRRLPPLLDAAEPALRRLATVTRDATPLLRELREAAPATTRLVDRAGPFARAARPTIETLEQNAPRARRAVRAATPIAGRLQRFARLALPLGHELDRVVVDLRDRGVVDNLMVLVYRLSATYARFDSVSHLMPIALFANACSPYAKAHNPACSARYGQPAATDAANTSPLSARTRRPRDRARGRGPAPGASRPAQPRPQPSPAPAAPGAPPSAPSAPPYGPRPVQDLLDFLLK